jgi:hypothetical protein
LEIRPITPSSASRSTPTKTADAPWMAMNPNGRTKPKWLTHIWSMARRSSHGGGHAPIHSRVPSAVRLVQEASMPLRSANQVTPVSGANHERWACRVGRLCPSGA